MPTPPAKPGPDETLDAITRDWWIFQLRRGHRFSTDDIATGWRASQARPDAKRLLDIGCGIGSVGLTTLWNVGPDATLVGVEAQALSAGLARRSVSLNGLEDRVTIIHADLRDTHDVPPELIPEGGFDLITGSPPYFPVGKGIIPEHPQKAGARFELRGSVYDYCTTARHFLAPGGAFAYVMAAADPRTEDAPLQAGLVVEERMDIRFKIERDPLICVLVCRREEDGPVERTHLELVVRGEDGEFTEAYNRFRAQASGLGPLAG